MKRSEMLEHIEAELAETIELIRVAREASESAIRRRAACLLDMLLGGGVLPPEWTKTIKPYKDQIRYSHIQHHIDMGSTWEPEK